MARQHDPLDDFLHGFKKLGAVATIGTLAALVIGSLVVAGAANPSRAIQDGSGGKNIGGFRTRDSKMGEHPLIAQQPSRTVYA